MNWSTYNCSIMCFGFKWSLLLWKQPSRHTTTQASIMDCRVQHAKNSRPMSKGSWSLSYTSARHRLKRRITIHPSNYFDPTHVGLFVHIHKILPNPSFSGRRQFTSDVSFHSTVQDLTEEAIFKRILCHDLIRLWQLPDVLRNKRLMTSSE